MSDVRVHNTKEQTIARNMYRSFSLKCVPSAFAGLLPVYLVNFRTHETGTGED